jgi:ribosome recycling factor
MIDDVLKAAEDRMTGTVKALNVDFQSIRTGRASPALIEHIKIDYYGMPTPLQQLAVINVPEPRILAVKPFNPGDIGAIERAILKSDLGLNPSNDGKIIRLIIPQLTQERRRDLVKQVAKRTEEGRVAIRNIRRDAIDDMRAWEKEGEISEDDLHAGQDRVQKLTDRYIKQIDEVGQKKEAEVMEV